MQLHGSVSENGDFKNSETLMLNSHTTLRVWENGIWALWRDMQLLQAHLFYSVATLARVNSLVDIRHSHRLLLLLLSKSCCHVHTLKCTYYFRNQALMKGYILLRHFRIYDWFWSYFLRPSLHLALTLVLEFHSTKLDDPSIILFTYNAGERSFGWHLGQQASDK